LPVTTAEKKKVKPKKTYEFDDAVSAYIEKNKTILGDALSEIEKG
jgi:hypothetical protein